MANDTVILDRFLRRLALSTQQSLRLVEKVGLVSAKHKGDATRLKCQGLVDQHRPLGE